MTAAELSLVIKAKDQSAKTFTAMKSHFNRLKANAKKVGQAMNRALGAGLRKTMDLTKKVMIGMAIAIAAVGAAVVKLRNDAKTYILQIDKMTKVTGMSTEEFSKLAYAADQEHASLETLSKSLPILSKYMAYAKDGMATYKREFDKMGITVTDTEGKLKSSYQVLLEMSDYMGREGANDTEKMAVMMTLLGRRGAELIPMLKKGSAWFGEMGKEAKSLGIVLDQKTVKAIKKSDDSLTALKKAFLGVGIAIIKAIEPSLERAQNAFKEYVKGARKWIDEHREDIREKLNEAWVKVEQVMKVAWGLMQKMMDAKWRAEQIEKIKDAFQTMLPYIQGAAVGMAIITAATNMWLVKLLAVAVLLKGIQESIKSVSGLFKFGKAGSTETEAKASRDYAQRLKESGGSAELIAKHLKRANELEQKSIQYANEYDKIMSGKFPLFDMLEKLSTGESPFKGMKDQIEGMKGMFDDIKTKVTTQIDSVKQQAGQEKNINALLESRKKILDSLQKARAKVPTADIRYTTAKGGVEEVVSKEYPSGIPAVQFDKTVAEAKAQNQALDDLGKATEGMLGDLIQNFNDGKIGIDKLVSGIAGYVNTANNLGIAEKAAFTQIFSLLKGLTSKTNSLSKAFNAQALKTKQLQGQLAGA